MTCRLYVVFLWVKGGKMDRVQGHFFSTVETSWLGLGWTASTCLCIFEEKNYNFDYKSYVIAKILVLEIYQLKMCALKTDINVHKILTLRLWMCLTHLTRSPFSYLLRDPHLRINSAQNESLLSITVESWTTTCDWTLWRLKSPNRGKMIEQFKSSIRCNKNHEFWSRVFTRRIFTRFGISSSPNRTAKLS